VGARSISGGAAVAVAVAALAGVAVVGCGSHGAQTVDGGAPQLTGLHSFDVVAGLSLGGAVPPSNLPPTAPFTLVLDSDANHAIVGAQGTAAVVPMGMDGDKRTLAKFSVGLPATQCSGASSIDFDSLSVTASSTSLTGTGAGNARVSCGDCEFMVPFMAGVEGGPDVTPPLLFSTSIPTNPFQTFRFVASEPLLATSTARLTGEDRTAIDLVPEIVPGDVPLVSSFDEPSVVLPTGVGLVIAIDQLVDFAGLHGATDTPLRFVVFPAAPLVPDAGFETTTDTTFGGATVVSDGPLPPISGTRSVYFGGQATPAPGSVPVGKMLLVRLAVTPGVTKLAFSYRLVIEETGSATVGFSGTVNVGSVGKAPVFGRFTTAPPSTRTTWPSGITVDVSDVATYELALPSDLGSEVLVDIEPPASGCGDTGPGFAPPPGGMLLDDLRLE
jgi:hypothetical protein